MDKKDSMLRIQEESNEDFVKRIIKEDEDYFLSNKWKDDGYRCYGKRVRSLLTINGKLEIPRYYYYNRKKKQGFFYIDEQYSLAKSQRITSATADVIVRLYGSVEVVTIAQTFGISKQTVYTILKERGIL